MKTYLIIYLRWIRGSTQNGEFLVGTSTRKKEAKGLCKSNFISHLENLLDTHRISFDDIEIDENAYAITLADEQGLWYHARFYWKEI